MFIPCGGGPNHGEIGGDLAAIAERTLEALNVLRPLRLVVDPRCDPERRSVTDVLTVMAVEESRPVTNLVDLEAGDPPQH